MLKAEVDFTIDVSAEDVYQAHRKRVKDAADLGWSVSQEEVPVDTGKLKQSGFPPEFRGEDVVFGYQADHAEAMEKGTPPMEVPIEPLERWGERIGKGADFGRWVAEVKIPEKGVNAQPYLRPSAERMRPWLDNHGLDL
ncbi:HK97 gp10-like/Mu G-like tail completion protein [Haloferax tailed virus 1]|uniref:HK97 gp10-like/Mu G-like tail completion protein n=1 Tax=Haloferax tailed virus 1 TaxID=2507575 RepID=A0A410N6V2_HFTV1|nr:HK97 gp10-like/Mu G-like tail completion protein [Haloferax tailed virus 1]QAS68860.1 HK97 gp10-like/Mu G-like tail completion protein [Haloferax tailed virus 1]